MNGGSALAIAALACTLSAISAGADPKPSVVTIYTELDNRGSGQGTGFFVGPRGLVATAFHVLEGATRLVVYDSENIAYEDVRIVTLDPAHDLALLRINTADEAYLRIAQRVPDAEETVRVVGSPRGLPNQTLVGRSTAGLISSLKISTGSGAAVFRRDIEVIPIDVSVYNGLSGAPVLAFGEQLVGVLSGSYDEGRGIAWAIPAARITELLTAPSLDLNVSSETSWPAFDLMASSWRSLRRQYDTVFSPEHIQKLEVLESLLPQIAGVWTSTTLSTRVVTETTSVRCEEIAQPDHMLTFSDIDYNEASIYGTFRRKVFVQAKSIQDLNLYGRNPLIERDCFKAVTGDTTLQDRLFNSEGTVAVFVDDDGEIYAVPFTKECFSGPCRASDYGEGRSEEIRIISDRVLIYGDEVFRRGSELR